MPNDRLPSAPGEFEDHFRRNAQRWLDAHGLTIGELMRMHPKLTPTQIASQISTGRGMDGVNGLGLNHLLFGGDYTDEEFAALCRDQLYRHVVEALNDPVRQKRKLWPSIRFGGWNFHAKISHPHMRTYVTAVMRALNAEYPPQPGWMPRSADDPWLVELFDRFRDLMHVPYVSDRDDGEWDDLK